MSEDRFRAHVACSVILQKNDQVFMLRRKNTGYQDGKFCFPSGHLEHKETLKAAAVREAQEEADVDVLQSDLKLEHVVIYPARGNAVGTYVAFFFTTKKWRGIPKVGEPDKASEARWINTAQIPDDVVPEVAQALRNIQQGIFESEFGW